MTTIALRVGLDGLSQKNEIHCLSVQSIKLLMPPRNYRRRHEKLTAWRRYLNGLNGLQP